MTTVPNDYLSLKMSNLNHPDLSFLWIGSKADAADKEALEKHNIYCIVNCTRDHLEGGVKNFNESEPGFRYIRVALKDQDSEVIPLNLLQNAWRFINKARDAKVNCLVHCAMGKSRSGAVLISYIMHATGMSYDDALALVRSVRPVVEPNSAFADQLRYFALSGEILKSE